MKLASVSALLAAIVLSYATPDTSTLTAPRMVSARMAESAPGDTLNYRAVWGGARGATHYRFAVRELWNPPGTFSGLPAGLITQDTTALFSAISTIADSARFRAVVWSRQGNIEHPDSSFVVWSVRRLGPPGPITIDSSLVIENITITPQNLVLEMMQGTVMDQAFCTIARFRGGAAAYQGVYAGALCDSIARTMGSLPTAAQQFRMDTTCFEFIVEREDGTPATFFVDRDPCGANGIVRFTR